ncbi:Glycosyl transferase, family 2 [gamma proteobacterium HdN1]|nr:Glycosyl transferase, family 2 [gamma proteobacterium HdN1]
MNSQENGFSCCAIIPVYNHEHAIADVVAQVSQSGLFCLLVDDGSEPSCADALDKIVQNDPQRVDLIRLAANQGKGSACVTGFLEAWRRGFTHALQVDADGQHDATAIPRFLELAFRNPDTVISGYAVYDHSVPKSRMIGRYVTHAWVWINTLSLAIRDSMCGFRCYPLEKTVHLINRSTIGARMNFDTDIIVKLHWMGASVINAPVQVTYPLDGVSHFRVLQDNLQISGMHAMHFFGMLLRLPRLLLRMLPA